MVCRTLYLLATIVLTSTIDANSAANIYSSINCSGGQPVVIAGECNLTSGCTVPWHYCDNGTCACGRIPNGTLQCDDCKSPPVSSWRCVTVDPLSYSTHTGHCLYGIARNNSNAVSDMCKRFNRTGTLCGKCKDGHYPLAYSFDMNCVECPDGKSNWWKYVLATFLPLTIFYFIVVLFRINVTSSRLHGFVFFCQGLVLPALAREMLKGTSNHKNVHTSVRYIGSLFSLWNLDIFRPLKLDICLGTDTLQTLALELAVGVYPLLLILLSYAVIHLYDSDFKPLVIFWKPFKAVFGLFRRNWEIKTSLIDAFATFFLLSIMKFLNTSFDILTPVTVYHLNSTGHLSHSRRHYCDATLPYFGERHLHYIILAIVVLTLFVLLPTLLLLLYPFHWFQKFLNLFPFRWYILHTFMDTFQGCYKDGTEPNTRDCQWFASIYLLARFLAMAIGMLTLDETFFPYVSILLVLIALSFITVQPFKSSSAEYSNINVIFILLLAVCFVSSSGYQAAKVCQKVLVMPFFIAGGLTSLSALVYISAIIVQWM